MKEQWFFLVAIRPACLWSPRPATIALLFPFCCLAFSLCPAKLRVLPIPRGITSSCGSLHWNLAAGSMIPWLFCGDRLLVFSEFLQFLFVRVFFSLFSRLLRSCFVRGNACGQFCFNWTRLDWSSCNCGVTLRCSGCGVLRRRWRWWSRYQINLSSETVIAITVQYTVYRFLCGVLRRSHHRSTSHTVSHTSLTA